MFRTQFSPKKIGFVDQAASAPQKTSLVPSVPRQLLKQYNLRRDKIRWLAEAIDKQQQKIRHPGI